MTSANRPPDEWANFLTHGVGLILSIVAIRYLMLAAPQWSNAMIAACGLFSFTLLLTYTGSTLSHAFYDLTWRQRCRTLDQASIFLLIAGTYTPFAILTLDDGAWPWLLTLMWLIAIGGVLRVLQVRDLSPIDKVAYCVLGCLPLAAFGELGRLSPPTVSTWLLAGGACYGVGAIFLRLSACVRYAHAVWHLFVIAGCACHYWALLLALSAGASLND